MINMISCMQSHSKRESHQKTNPPVKEWVSRIQEIFAQGRDRTLDLARLVSNAEQQLPYAEWAELKSGGLSFSKRKLELLAAVGTGLGRLDAQNSAHLPPAWNTLYYLARLPQPLLERLIGASAFQSEAGRRDGEELPIGGPQPTKAARTGTSGTNHECDQL